MDVNIHIRLYATLKRFMSSTPDGSLTIEPGTTVGQVLKVLGVPESEAKLIFVDSKKASLETALTGGERVGIFPPVGGG